MISKMILASNQLGCSEEIITIAAILSVQVKIIFLRCYLFLYLSYFVAYAMHSEVWKIVVLMFFLVSKVTT